MRLRQTDSTFVGTSRLLVIAFVALTSLFCMCGTPSMAQSNVDPEDICETTWSGTTKDRINKLRAIQYVLLTEYRLASKTADTQFNVLEFERAQLATKENQRVFLIKDRASSVKNNANALLQARQAAVATVVQLVPGKTVTLSDGSKVTLDAIDANTGASAGQSEMSLVEKAEDRLKGDGRIAGGYLELTFALNELQDAAKLALNQDREQARLGKEMEFKRGVIAALETELEATRERVVALQAQLDALENDLKAAYAAEREEIEARKAAGCEDSVWSLGENEDFLAPPFGTCELPPNPELLNQPPAETTGENAEDFDISAPATGVFPEDNPMPEAADVAAMPSGGTTEPPRLDLEGLDPEGGNTDIADFAQPYACCADDAGEGHDHGDTAPSDDVSTAATAASDSVDSPADPIQPGAPSADIADFSLPYACCEDDAPDPAGPAAANDAPPLPGTAPVAQLPEPMEVIIPEFEPVEVEIPTIVRPKGLEAEYEALLNAPPTPESLSRMMELLDAMGVEVPSSTAASIPAPATPATPAGMCKYDAEAICNRLGIAMDSCLQTVKMANTQCEIGLQSGPVEACRAACTARGELASLGMRLRDMALARIAPPQPDPGKIAALESALQATQSLRDAKEGEIKDRVIQIYTNSDTGAIIQHDGPYFEPTPPIIHTGDMQAPPKPEDLAALADLDAEVAELQAALDAAQNEGNDPHAEWRAQAMSVWQKSMGSGPEACNAPGDISGQIETCNAICDALGTTGIATPMDVCRQSANPLGMLSQEGVQRWLDPCYSPG